MFGQYGKVVFVVTKRRLDRSEWSPRMVEPRTATDLDVMHLPKGAVLPRRFVVAGVYQGGPLIVMRFEVVKGRPELALITIGQTADDPMAVVPIRAALVRNLPVNLLVDEALAEAGAATLWMLRMAEDEKAGRGPSGLSPLELDIARGAALVSRRGRPVTDEILRRVAEMGRDDPTAVIQKIQSELHTSKRTAYRWAMQSRERFPEIWWGDAND